jgi:hypothetical protein
MRFEAGRGVNYVPSNAVLLYPDGTPHSADEIKLIRAAAG